MELIICRNCGRAAETRFRFCSFCGSPLNIVKEYFCKGCANVIPGYSRFCGFCGRPCAEVKEKLLTFFELSESELYEVSGRPTADSYGKIPMQKNDIITSVENKSSADAPVRSRLEDFEISEEIGAHRLQKYKGKSKEVIIPSGIVKIDLEAFMNCKELVKVTIPVGVIRIGNFAFQDCSSLTGVYISEGLESIGYGAFSGCYALEKITIPSSVKIIQNEAFKYCSKLTIYCRTGSYAEKYARARNIKVISAES